MSSLARRLAPIRSLEYPPGMCCFSPVTAPISLLSWLLTPKVHVSATKIFARMVEGGEQVLAYAMTLSVAGPVAMILPVPVPPGAGESALRFIDLSSRPTFFEVMEELFHLPLPLARKGGLSLNLTFARPRLVVHRVGAFEASFVPSRADMDRLDPRFRLPDAVWDALRGYDDWGFAVFQLAAGKRQHIHPMAFRFRAREEKRLFFPTVHVHDGKVHPRARFDHSLYYQHPDAPLCDWGSLRDFQGALVSALPCGDDNLGLTVRGASVLRRELRGKLPNQDTWVSL